MKKNDYNTLKCSELENFEFYTGLLVVENIFPKIYWDHYLTYVRARRLLTKDKIDHDDITSTFTLLNYFFPNSTSSSFWFSKIQTS